MSKKFHPLASFSVRVVFAHFLGVTAFLLALMVVAMLSSEDTQSGSFFASIPSLIAFLALLYTEVWREAERDHNRVLYGHVQADRLRPFKIAACTEGVMVIIAILLCTPAASYWPRLILKLYYLPYYAFVNAVEASYPVVYFLPVVVTAGVIIAAYKLGYSGTRLSDKIIYLNDKDKKPREKLR